MKHWIVLIGIFIGSLQARTLDYDRIAQLRSRYEHAIQDEVAKPKVLHLTFHKGCCEEVKMVAQELGLDLTSWHIFGAPLEEFEGRNSGHDVYNMFADRAQRIWEKHKDYFNQFDVIWLSDTAPLCRIFLQNNWKKPLIVWICNRFDYSHQPSAFPDESYNELFKKALTQENVWVISYTPYEWFYALKKGIDIGIHVIKPIGVVNLEPNWHKSHWNVPESVDKPNTVLIDPHVNHAQKEHLTTACKRMGIPAYCGTYNGPGDMQEFKGVMFWTYQWSNMCLFENIQLGKVHFVPSKKFVKELCASDAPTHHVMQFMDQDNTYQFNEWYAPEHKDIIVYYDSWEDLKDKVANTDYAAMRKKIIAFADDHKRKMLKRWRRVFSQVYEQLGATYDA